MGRWGFNPLPLQNLLLLAVLAGLRRFIHLARVVPGLLLDGAHWLLTRCPSKDGLLFQARRGHHLLRAHRIMHYAS